MPVQKHTVWYALAGLVVLLALGLVWWFYFLRAKEATITSADAARGYGTAAPVPANPIGSTYSNIIEGLSSLIGAGEGGEPAAPGTLPTLWHVTKTPVAGLAFESGSPKLLFAERSTGYILEADPLSHTAARLTNKLVPKTYEAVFGADGDVILRSLDEVGLIGSFAGTITGFSGGNATSSGMELRGGDLARGIVSLIPIRATREIVYLVKDLGGGSSVVRSSWSGAKRTILWSSPLAGWRLAAPGDGRIFLVQKAADDVPGFAYELKAGALVPSARGIGLTFLPRAGSAVALAGESQGGVLTLSARRADGTALALPIKTIADKCVWAPTPTASAAKKPKAIEPQIAYCAVPQTILSSAFLDDWYRGALHTSDTWWRVDANDGTVEQVDLSDSPSAPLDVENPAIDAAGTQIAFMNARDQSLWLLRIPSMATTTP